MSQKPVRNSADVGIQNCFGMSENTFALFTLLKLYFISNPKSHNEYSTGGVESEYFLGFGANDASTILVCHFLQSLFAVHIPAE